MVCAMAYRDSLKRDECCQSLTPFGHHDDRMHASGDRSVPCRPARLFTQVWLSEGLFLVLLGKLYTGAIGIYVSPCSKADAAFVGYVNDGISPYGSGLFSKRFVRKLFCRVFMEYS